MATAIAVGANLRAQKARNPIAPYVSAQSVPLEVRGGSIFVNTAAMAPSRFYCIELNGQPYIYRKTPENELEVYGLADSP